MNAPSASAFGGRLLSAAPTIPKHASRIAREVLCVGFDTEWDADTKDLISVQFAVKLPDVSFRTAVFYPLVRRLTVQLLLGYLEQFLRREGLVPPLHRKQHRVALVAHFAAAELGMLADPLAELKIRQVGKAHHAAFPQYTDSTGAKWHIRLVDLYAFYKSPLAAIGNLVNLPKLDEDRTALRQLALEERDRFERYAARDAEIAVAAFDALRATMLSTWRIDVLTKPSLSSLASDIFRRHFLRTPPVSVKYMPIVARRRSSTGWSQRLKPQPFFSGSNEVRELAHQSYAGGRVEAYVLGLVKAPVAEFDVVSLYPHAAILQPLPNANTKWVAVNDLSTLAQLEGFGTFAFEFPKEAAYPCLLVKHPGIARTMFPLQGETSCTFAEIRAALRLGATIKIKAAWGFMPGPAERDHDVARYMKHWIAVKNNAPRKSLYYQNAKLLLNSLIGKFAERHRDNSILELERVARAEGHPGIGRIVASSSILRETLRGDEEVGGLWLPEWASLILGKARALMADIAALGALLISTDSIIIRTPVTLDAASIKELRSVGSDLINEVEGDAVFIARNRLYAILQRAEQVRPGAKVLARDDTWAVVRVARHATPETETEFAETVLRCLAARRDVAPERERTQLLTAQRAARLGQRVNDEVTQRGKTHFRWDRKRRLLNRDVNIFTGFSATRPYLTAMKLLAAEYEAAVRRGELRKRRRERAPEVTDEVFALIEQGYGVREIARRTGVPKSTVGDLKKTLDAEVPRPGVNASPSGAPRRASVPKATNGKMSK